MHGEIRIECAEKRVRKDVDDHQMGKFELNAKCHTMIISKKKFDKSASDTNFTASLEVVPHIDMNVCPHHLPQ